MIRKSSFLLISLLFLFSFAFGQKINQAEFDFLIKPFTKEKNEQNQLQKIHEYIILSDYESAVKLIQNNSSNQRLKPALWTYSSVIEYIKSNYQVSSDLCDSVLIALKSNKQNGYYIRAINYKAKAISALGNNKKALKLVEMASRLAKSSNDKYQLGSCYYYLGVFRSETGEFKKAVNYLINSKRISEELKDKISLGATSSFLGLCYSHEGRYSEAIELLNRSIIVRLEIGDKRGLANSYLNMNKVYTELNDSKKRFEFENKSLKICNEIGDLQCISGRLTNIGDIHFLEADYKKALYYQKKALSIARKLGINYRIAEIHHHLAQIYNATKKYDLAISHIDSSLNLRNAIQENEGIGNSLVIKSTILLNQDKIDEALSIANESLNISKKFGLIHLIRDGNLILSKIYEKNGSKDKALTSLKTYHLLKDSLLDIDKSKLIIRNELERKYELNELKNKKIQSEKEFQLQKQKVRTKNIIWIGIVLTLSFFVLVYLLYQKYLAQRKINNVVIENQKLNRQIDNLEKRSIFSQTISSVAHELNTPLGVIFAGTKELTQTISQINNFFLDERINSHHIKQIQYWIPYISKNEDKPLNGRSLRKNAIFIYDKLKEKSNISVMDLEEIAMSIAKLDLGDKTSDFVELIHTIDRPIDFINCLLELKKIKQLELSIDFAVEGTKKVVSEMNILADNQTSFQDFENFNLHNLISNLIEQNSELKENEIEITLNIEKSKSIYFERISFVQIVSLIIQNSTEAFENPLHKKNIRISNYIDGDFEILAIENNGPKIQDDHLNMIFNKFFTTKNKSYHRGLGLSTVKTILEGFGGSIRVKSNEKSTIFEMYFRTDINNNLN